MRIYNPYKNIFYILLQFSALLAEKINKDTNPSSLNYKSLLVFLYNSIFGVFISAVLSLCTAFLISPFTGILVNNFRTFFLILMVITGVMLITNLPTNQLNLPMLFLRVIFFIKFKIKSIMVFILVRVFISVFAIYISVYFLHSIIIKFLSQYGVQGEYISMYAYISSAALIVAGYYAFPVEKHERDLNELVLSPILIILNIRFSYQISKTNILHNLESGNVDIAAQLLIIFAIATFLQFVAYLKKLFEKIHDLPEYSRRTYFYAYLARKRISFGINQIKYLISQIIKLIKELKSIKKDRNFYLKLITSTCLTVGTWFMIIPLSRVKLPGLKLSKSVEIYLSYIIISAFIIFMTYRVYCLLILSLKGREHFERRTRWELFGIAITIFGVLITMIIALLSIELKFFIYLASLFIIIGAFIVSVSSLIRWLFTKRKAKKEA